MVVLGWSAASYERGTLVHHNLSVTPRIPRFYGHPINLIAPAQASFITTSVGSHVERFCSILRSTKSRISPSILQYTKSNTQDSTCLWASNKTHRARSGKLHRNLGVTPRIPRFCGQYMSSPQDMSSLPINLITPAQASYIIGVAVLDSLAFFGQGRSPGSAYLLCRGGRRPLLSGSLLPLGGRALVKRLVLGVSKVDWTTTIDCVVKSHRTRAGKLHHRRGSAGLARSNTRDSMFLIGIQ